MPKPPSGAMSPANVGPAVGVATVPSSDGHSAVTPSRSYHHGNLRKAFLDQALDVIAREGVEAVNLRSLARDVGVSNAAHRRHFETRVDLLNEIATDGYRYLSTTITASLGSADPIANAKAMAKSYILWTVQNRAIYAVIRSSEARSNADPTLKAIVGVLMREYCKLIKAARTSGWRNEVTLHHASTRLYIQLIGISEYLYGIGNKTNSVDLRRITETILIIEENFAI